jgi:hypothetical protein
MEVLSGLQIAKHTFKNLEKVQRRFLKFLAYRIDGTYPERGRSQSELLERFECQDLKTRRVNASMSFLRNLIHYRIDCSKLLSKLYFLVPRLTSRNHVCFTYLLRVLIFRNILLYIPCAKIITYINMRLTSFGNVFCMYFFSLAILLSLNWTRSVG